MKDFNKLSVLVLNDVVIFPNSEVRIEFDNIQDNYILDAINNITDELVLVVNPIEDGSNFNITHLPKVGLIARLKYKLNVPNGRTRIVIEGISRVEIYNYEEKNNYFVADHNELKIETTHSQEVYYDLLLKNIYKYVDSVPYMGNAIISQVDNMSSLSDLCDLLSSYLEIPYNTKKDLILTIDPIKRTKMLIEEMRKEIQLFELENKIEKSVEKELSDQQKEFFLREKIHAIEKELGEVSSKEDELASLKKKAKSIKAPSKIKKRIDRELGRYESTPSTSPELGIIREYLDWMLNLPWQKYTKDVSNLKLVKEKLDSSHYALDEVKERIIEYIAVKQNTNNLRSPILCLVGPPGVGKTSLAISIADSLGRKSTKISVGGINDEAEIIGHRRTYIGANPGRIIQGIRRAGTTNPVFIIDEIDKMTKDIKGDPASALLEVLDPEQNSKFSDHYI